MGAIISPIAVQISRQIMIESIMVWSLCLSMIFSENRFTLFRIMRYIAADRAEAQRV
jgi:hypothetical protein